MSGGVTPATRWPPGTEVIGKTADYYSSGRLPENLGFFEGEELTVLGATTTGRSYETRRKRDGAVKVISVDDVVPELTKRPGKRRKCDAPACTLHAAVEGLVPTGYYSKDEPYPRLNFMPYIAPPCMCHCGLMWSCIRKCV